MTQRLRLGVNIDHVATLRNARGIGVPDPARAAASVEAAGADGVTLHLREDRRHIRDADLPAIKSATGLPLNLETAVSDEMLDIACAFKPHATCLVPERRQEVTTEGGLDLISMGARLTDAVDRLAGCGARVSLFIDPDQKQIEAAAASGAPVIELHTGAYCHAFDADPASLQTHAEFNRIKQGAALAAELGLEVHAGHGLNYASVVDIAAIPELAELNIGHFLIGESMFVGLMNAIAKMRKIMDRARA